MKSFRCVALASCAAISCGCGTDKVAPTAKTLAAKKLLEKMPIYYETTEHPTKTTLMAFVGNGALYDEDQKGHSFFQIRDGLTNRIMLVEAGPDKAVPWTKPDDLIFDPQNPKAALGTLREDFLLTLMAEYSNSPPICRPTSSEPW